MSTALQPDINIGPSAVIAGWVEASIAIIVVGARTYTQARVVGRMGIDDYLMILALVTVLPNLTNSSNIYCSLLPYLIHPSLPMLFLGELEDTSTILQIQRESTP